MSEQWSLKAGGLLIQVVSNTGLTVNVIDKLKFGLGLGKTSQERDKNTQKSHLVMG